MQTQCIRSWLEVVVVQLWVAFGLGLRVPHTPARHTASDLEFLDVKACIINDKKFACTV